MKREEKRDRLSVIFSPFFPIPFLFFPFFPFFPRLFFPLSHPPPPPHFLIFGWVSLAARLLLSSDWIQTRQMCQTAPSRT